MKRIILSKIIYDDILAYCESKLPEEALGLLAGKKSGPFAHVDSFIPIRNVSNKPRTCFAADPAEWIKAWFFLESSGQIPIGLLHSHPSAPPLPSAADLAAQWYSIPSHWIVSLSMPKTPIVEAFRFRADGSYEPIRWELDFA